MTGSSPIPESNDDVLIGQEIPPGEVAAILSRTMPPGSRVRYWTGEREGPGLPGHVRTPFFVAPSGDVCVIVREYGAWLAASHVEPD